MTYRAYVDGFSASFVTVAAVQAWLSDLDRRHSLKGCTLKVWKATWVGRECASYSAAPSLVKVL